MQWAESAVEPTAAEAHMSTPSVHALRVRSRAA